MPSCGVICPNIFTIYIPESAKYFYENLNLSDVDPPHSCPSARNNRRNSKEHSNEHQSRSQGFPEGGNARDHVNLSGRRHSDTSAGGGSNRAGAAALGE